MRLSNTFLVAALALLLGAASGFTDSAARQAAAPKAYVGLDTDSDRVLTRINVPTGPHGRVVTPDGR
jgi:hypothetical protein